MFAEPGQYRVLIVEDEPSIAAVLKEGLEPMFVAETVDTLGAATQRLGEKPRIDAVLLDLILPNSVGANAVHLLHCRFLHVPLIVISGAAVEEEEVLNAGAQAFFRKPTLSIPDIRTELARCIIRHKVWMEEFSTDAEVRELRKELVNSLGRIDRLEKVLGSCAEKAKR